MNVKRQTLKTGQNLRDIFENKVCGHANKKYQLHQQVSVLMFMEETLNLYNVNCINHINGGNSVVLFLTQINPPVQKKNNAKH